jgi:hypothetical protein
VESAFIADRWEIEGNLGYVHHFQFENSSGPRSGTFVWESGPSVNFHTNFFQNVPGTEVPLSRWNELLSRDGQDINTVIQF